MNGEATFPGALPPARAQFPYVLVADRDERRIAASVLEASTAFDARVLVVHDAADAFATIRRIGPPRLLLLDPLLDPADGAVRIIDALREAGDTRSAIIAWAARREIREVAAYRLAGLNAKVLGAGSRLLVLRNAIAWARRVAAGDAADPASETSEQLRTRIAKYARAAGSITGAAGVAVYLRDPDDDEYRASVTWTGDEPIPASPDFLPRAFAATLDAPDGFVLSSSDDSTQADADVALPDRIAEIAGVPIYDADSEMVGAIVVFDVRHLHLRGVDFDEFRAIGRPGLTRTRVRADRVAIIDPVVDAWVRGARRGFERTDAGGSAREIPDAMVARFAMMREIARARREQVPLSVMLFAVSPERSVDVPADEPGEPLAAQQLFAQVTRASDLAVRWSAEHLLLVAGGLTESAAQHVAERVRSALEAASGRQLSVLAGVAALKPEDTLDAGVARANEQLEERIRRDRML